MLDRLAQRGAGAAQRQDRSQGAGGAADRDGDAAERRDPRARAGRRGACLTPPSAAARTIRRPARTTRRAAQFTELRSLLVGPEQRQLRALQTRARGSGRAGARRQPRPRHGRRAADQRSAPETGARAHHRRNHLGVGPPQPAAAGRRAVPDHRPGDSQGDRRDAQRHARVAQHHARAQPLVAIAPWRLDARRTGKSFAEIVLLNTLVYRVEQVFLIHRPSGLLLQHLTAPGTAGAGRRHRVGHADRDSRLRAGLLQGLRGRGAADAEGRRALGAGSSRDRTRFSPSSIRGTAPPALRQTLQQALESVHAQYSDLLESFDGNAARIRRGAAAARRLPAAAVPRHAIGPGGSRRRVTVLARDRACSRSACGCSSASATAGDGMPTSTRLRAEPGIVVVSTGRDGGKYMVSGLRDPLARDPAALPAAAPARRRRGRSAAGSCIRRCTRRWCWRARASSWRRRRL